MKNFVKFLLDKVYKAQEIPDSYIEEAFLMTFKDVRYHFPEISQDIVKNKVQSNSNELAIFLFRLGSILYQKNLECLHSQIHWILKEVCSCELYFNNQIDEGFYVVHGEGTVIGSRNIIGKGFKIHQGCTIGHRKNGGGEGNRIGDNVVMYCNSSIIGQLNIGSNIIIGAHVVIKSNLENDTTIT